jgi:hypothetical protein
VRLNGILLVGLIERRE